MAGKTILLTGATGFLGSHLLKFWIDKGHRLVVLKRSTSSTQQLEGYLDRCSWYNVDQPNWERVFDAQKINTIVHVAASYGRNGEDLSDIMESNTLFPLRLLELAIQNDVKHFINTASSLPRNINAYALSKAQFQDWLLHKKKEIHSVNVELEYFYGPGDADWKFISMVIKKLLNKESSIDFTQGLQKRDFIYIDDVVSAFDVILNRIEDLDSVSIIPVGSGKSYSLRSVVEMCKQILNNSTTTLNFGAIPDRKGEVNELVADTSLIESLGWLCEHSLERGLNKFIK
ncbi:NAD-dependent epimerase/dehydratase family protein [Cyclobacterium salsum]|uniref:NAD-dependent epimerase/dehydratase family protein n=1 Tax=Cyclobacterium salsum TaxID=2666329 RepID=UPI001391C6D9|nr:NAD-dependent epimerase/dehydratase [Cyclobacterium salsum]